MRILDYGIGGWVGVGIGIGIGELGVRGGEGRGMFCCTSHFEGGNSRNVGGFGGRGNMR